MTFRNKHSFIGGFLCAALFISGSCALGGCTEITEPQGIDEAGNRPSLTVRATASDFVSCVQEDAPVTRTPTENGYTTEFNNGDAIGIFAIRGIGSAGATLVDETDNCKLVCTVAADGTRSWAPAAGDTHVVYSYDETITYVAYYPYRDGITIDPADTADEIIKSLAGNANLQPATDQSTPAAYTGSDLMAVVATPTTDPSDANKKVLTLAFEHLHALLVFKPSEGFLRYVSPDGGFEYRDEAKIPINSVAAEATINNVKACPMGDGSFRAIIPAPPSATAFTPSGNYRLADGKTIILTGSQLTAGTLTAGKYYTLQTNPQFGTKPRKLQIGDFFYRDGKFLNRDISAVPSTNECVGVVFYVGRHPSDTGTYLDKNGNSMEVHGYAVALNQTDRLGHIGWGGPGVYSNTSTDTDDFNGYSNTLKIKEAAGGTLTGNGGVPACYNWSAPVPNTTSGWFCPSAGQLHYMSLYYSSLIQPSMSRVGGAITGGEYRYLWSSSEPVNDGGKAYTVGWPGGGIMPYTKGGWVAAQAVIAF